MINQTNIFIGGTDGYHTYRIPVLALAADGTVLAFCEGRKFSPADDGAIDLLLKRSLDDGRTWSGQTAIHSEGDESGVTIGNPCPVVNRATGVISLLFTRNNKRLLYTHSRDNGESWSAPEDISTLISDFDFPAVRIGTGPVHGIHMTNGRMIVPTWLSDGERLTDCEFRSGIIYSDDRGATWQAGGLVPPVWDKCNECTVLEKPDGDLLLNMRANGPGYRAESISRDSGMTWDKPVLREDLPCPTCQAGMLRLSDHEILFSNPAIHRTGKNNAQGRTNLTVRLSLDNGMTWDHSRILESGPSAYSDLAIAKDGIILCVYECGDELYHERIRLARFDRKDII